VDRQTGIALTNGGYFYEGPTFQTFEGQQVPDNMRAAAFDIQNPTQPFLVGGVSALPSGDEGRELIRRWLEYEGLKEKQFLHDLDSDLFGGLAPEEEARLEELAGTHLATAVDAVRVLPVEELEEGVLRKRLYVAGGNGGLARLNLDELNGLQFLSQVLDANSTEHVGDVAKLGYAAFAAQAHEVAAWPPESFEPCTGKPGDEEAFGTVEEINYFTPDDPVYTGTLEDEFGNPVQGGNAVMIQGDWLYAGGQRFGYGWIPCPNSRELSGFKPKDTQDDTVRGIHLYDRVLTREYAFDNNVQDLVAYGEYLIVALGGGGIEILHRERPEIRTSFELTSQLQPNFGRAVRLRRMANLLFISAAGGGVIVADIADPLAPRVVSAGNSEAMEAVDVYKDRLITVAADSGLTVLEIPPLTSLSPRPPSSCPVRSP
jgi:hypothetical protein